MARRGRVDHAPVEIGDRGWRRWRCRRWEVHHCVGVGRALEGGIGRDFCRLRGAVSLARLAAVDTPAAPPEVKRKGERQSCRCCPRVGLAGHDGVVPVAMPAVLLGPGARAVGRWPLPVIALPSTVKCHHGIARRFRSGPQQPCPGWRKTSPSPPERVVSSVKVSEAVPVVPAALISLARWWGHRRQAGGVYDQMPLALPWRDGDALPSHLKQLPEIRPCRSEPHWTWTLSTPRAQCHSPARR